MSFSLVGEEGINIVVDSKKQLENSWKAVQKNPPYAHLQSSCIEGAMHNINYKHVMEDNSQHFQCKAFSIGAASEAISHSSAHLH